MASMVSQKGQALIAMLVLTIVLAIALVYLFNSSQLLSERAKAKVLADHAAHNTATKQAQLLNANAYMNKAKITNQLAVAQSVSIASWAEYIQSLDRNSSILESAPPVGTAIRRIMQASNEVAKAGSRSSMVQIQANGLATYAISKEQYALNKAAQNGAFLTKEPSTILKHSSIGNNFQANLLNFSIISNRDFLQHYAGKDRVRMRDVVMEARDAFTASRRRKHTQKILDLWAYKTKMEYRGGTDISADMNQWKALDTMSFWIQTRTVTWRGPRIRKRELPLGYGSAFVGNPSDSRECNSRSYVAGGHMHAHTTNPRATRSAKTFSYIPNWDACNYRMAGEYGIPEYWDLSHDMLKADNPTQDFSVKIYKKREQLDTTTGLSDFKVGDTIDIDTPKGVVAISTAQVYFERPLKDRQGNPNFLNSGKKEKASLFNPYWQVKMVDNPALAVAEASR